jgi:hypothetical protein
MTFVPAPPNEFREFVHLYYERCKKVCPKLIGAAGKWEYEDLIPGLSDFDTRLIFGDSMDIADWAQASLAVGEVHTRLAWERPAWARILEHLPGVNSTPSELTEPLFYFPESRQWTFYHGDKQVLSFIQGALASHPWSPRDELFHLQRFAHFWGPYQRGIDPPINIGTWENKYMLHSRFLHYFSPAVQCAVSLWEKRPYRGKFASLRAARQMFPNAHVIDMALEAVDRHYEIPEWYAEPRLTEIEKALRSYLDDTYRTFCGCLTSVDGREDDTPEALKGKLGGVQADRAAVFHDNTKFSRLMKGRLLFFATPIPWFDSTWLIQNELGRIIELLFDGPFRAVGQALWGLDLAPESVLERLRGELLPDSICKGVLRFVEVASARGIPAREHARQVADSFEPLQFAIETLRAKLADGALTKQGALPLQ